MLHFFTFFQYFHTQYRKHLFFEPPKQLLQIQSLRWVNMLKRNNKFEDKWKFFLILSITDYLKILKSFVNILFLIFTYGFHLKKLLTYEIELPHSSEKRLHLLNLYDGYAPKLKKDTRPVETQKFTDKNIIWFLSLLNMHANLDNVVYLDNFYSPLLIANLPNLSCERILHFFSILQ